MDALRAWDSAIARDHPAHASVFETIAEEEGDRLRGLGYHIYYGTLPPYGPGGGPTLLRGGDMPTGQALPNRQYRPFVDSIARVYGDAVLAGWGRALEARWPLVGGEGTYHPIHRYGLPYNLPLDVAPAGPGDPRLAGLPLGRIWGRADLGYAILRSGWGVGDTLVGYRAGKWFTGHQHLDQGHLDIWRRGRWHWTRGCTRAGDRSTARRSTCARWRTTRCWCRARARCSRGIRAARAA